MADPYVARNKKYFVLASAAPLFLVFLFFLSPKQAYFFIYLLLLSCQRLLSLLLGIAPRCCCGERLLGRGACPRPVVFLRLKDTTAHLSW